MKGIVFDIQKFSLYDGPGIRTNVFLKGCNMRCKWCHNPESFSSAAQLAFDAQKCINCGRCAEVCANGVHIFENNGHDINYSDCIACGGCVRTCPAEALEIYGRQMEHTDVIKEVLKDRKYYEASGGGVTFSGGEPTVQSGFLLELMREAKREGLNICIETNGRFKASLRAELKKYVDVWLIDYKATGEELHRELTGASQKLTLENIYALAEEGENIVLRCPMIPGVNDTDMHFKAIGGLKDRLGIKAELMPYHNMGNVKWNKIGMDCTIKQQNADKEQWKEQTEKWLRQ